MQESLRDLSVEANYDRWNNRYNWKCCGEEWNYGEDWKVGLAERLLQYIEPDSIVLEIGPGAGRWTVYLQRAAGCLILVDLSDKCINMCKARFNGYTNIIYTVNDGRSLPGVADSSVSFVWSYDVFVHVIEPDVDLYVKEIRRVLKPGAVGIIHHPNTDEAFRKKFGEMRPKGSYQGLRAEMTTGVFSRILAHHGLAVVEHFSKWGDKGQFRTRYDDVITVFRRRDG